MRRQTRGLRSNPTADEDIERDEGDLDIEWAEEVLNRALTEGRERIYPAMLQELAEAQERAQIFRRTLAVFKAYPVAQQINFLKEHGLIYPDEVGRLREILASYEWL